MNLPEQVLLVRRVVERNRCMGAQVFLGGLARHARSKSSPSMPPLPRPGAAQLERTRHHHDLVRKIQHLLHAVEQRHLNHAAHGLALPADPRGKHPSEHGADVRQLDALQELRRGLVRKGATGEKARSRRAGLGVHEVVAEGPRRPPSRRAHRARGPRARARRGRCATPRAAPAPARPLTSPTPSPRRETPCTQNSLPRTVDPSSHIRRGGGRLGFADLVRL